jgi:ADP-ribosylation factor protein 1
VIDANDPARLEEAKEELYGVLGSPELENVPLLVYANKQDLPNSLSTAQIVDKLELQSKLRTRQWHCQGAVAVTGQGLYEGLDWLSLALNKRY